MKDFGITQKELRYLPLKKEVRAEEERKFDAFDWLISLFLGAVIAGAVIGILVSIFLLTDRAEAAEPETNQEFCAGIDEGTYQPLPEDEEAITSYCAGIHE